MAQSGCMYSDRNVFRANEWFFHIVWGIMIRFDYLGDFVIVKKPSLLFLIIYSLKYLNVVGRHERISFYCFSSFRSR